jgi:hypothetical protein
MHERLKLATIAVLVIGVAAAPSVAADDSVGESLEEALYWLEKPAWDDRPSYAENIELEYSATDLIQKRETRQVCTGYNNTTLDNGTTVQECDSYENQSFAGENAPIFNITGNNNSYLGDGHVRTNLTIGTNELSTQTLKQTTFLMNRSKYVDWFNQRYYYNSSNITSEEVDELENKLQSMSAYGSNTNLKATQVNSLEITSLDPFKASADTTMVFRFNDFKTGSFVLSDLIRVWVKSDIA